MITFDIVLLVLVSLYAFFISIKMLSLRKVNPNYQILQKHKPNLNETIDLLNQKLPTVITGEVEEWFIFDEQDNIVPDKLNNQTLNENSKNLCYPFPIVKKYQIQDFASNHHTQIQTQHNTRHFLVLLSGELSIYLLQPAQKNEIRKNNNLLTNTNLKYIEIKLYAEQVLHIPYNWHYAFKCHRPSKILEVNSETLVTLPIKFMSDFQK